ncbi:bifunctional 2-polyprenyl-6-hydroxyphenol methylase/3-demethylubiquinol 3-O-methyltransferase UbiG [Polynucleobacter wuianus]|uniref:class I SAM-dependent methyltransferase n=1 Tax=Polynucleobacter TaxID=44013 RepID=UPI000AF8A32C|nr:SAM-dependent methyltransferase [Polynucleobacter wuianus]
MNFHDAQADASPWVKRFASQIPKEGLVLDLACGGGRHAKYLAMLGYPILAVDQDVTIVEQLKNPLITSKACNLELEEWPLAGLECEGIVVTNYLYRPHLDLLPKMLSKGGVLIYETFAHGNAQFGKPANPNFLLNSGELLALAARHDLKVLAYEDIYTDEPKPAMVQRLCALKAG